VKLDLSFLLLHVVMCFSFHRVSLTYVVEKSGSRDWTSAFMRLPFLLRTIRLKLSATSTHITCYTRHQCGRPSTVSTTEMTRDIGETTASPTENYQLSMDTIRTSHSVSDATAARRWRKSHLLTTHLLRRLHCMEPRRRTRK
jgi:hypothetical protein